MTRSQEGPKGPIRPAISDRLKQSLFPLDFKDEKRGEHSGFTGPGPSVPAINRSQSPLSLEKFGAVRAGVGKHF